MGTSEKVNESSNQSPHSNEEFYALTWVRGNWSHESRFLSPMNILNYTINIINNIYRMKFKNSEIGNPTLEQTIECCKMLKLAVPAEEVYNHYKKRNFLTKKKLPLKSLEAMCAAHNGVYLQRLRKKCIQDDPFGAEAFIEANKYANAEKWINKNFDTFCDNMKIIMERNPQKYLELCHKFRERL